jgi:hypothetical protein
MTNKVREALEAARDTLSAASRQLTDDHKIVLGGKRWGETTIAKIAAALAALDAETEVKVRELEWETGKQDYRYKGAIYNGIEAKIFTGGRYVIDLIQFDPDAPPRGGVMCKPFDPYISLQCSSWSVLVGLPRPDTLEAAKAVAQADFERRIRFALVTPEARS